MARQVSTAARPIDALVERVHKNRPQALAALFGAAAVLLLACLYLVPATAYIVARTLPDGVKRSIGHGVLAHLDSKVLSPTTLPPHRQHEIIDAFSRLTLPPEGVPRYRILFRAGPVGPNAFALPSGDIILTDDMVRLVDSDEELMGVLGHELGHLHERHMTQQLLQSSLIATVRMLLSGDASPILANIPAAMADMSHSRGKEADADHYSVGLLKANGISPEQLARVLDKMDKAGADDPMPYLSTHRMSPGRVQRIRAAAARD